MSAKLDLAGQRFGALIAVRVVGNKGRLGLVWECHCDCGATAEFVAAQLRYRTRSCKACSAKRSQKAFAAERKKTARKWRGKAQLIQFRRTGSLYGPSDEGGQ